MKKITFYLLLTCLLNTGISFSQTPPTIEWQKEYWAPNHISTGIAQTQKESDEEWFYDIEISKTNGSQNGYICAGYSKYINWQSQESDDCYNVPLSTPSSPNTELEFAGHVKGNSTAALSLIDSNGKTVWYNDYVVGAEFYNVIQASDGGYIAVGRTRSTKGLNGIPLRYNPARTTHPIQFPDKFFTSSSCNSPIDPSATKFSSVDKALVVKVSAAGALEWQYIYGMEQFKNLDGRIAYTSSTIAWDIVETPNNSFRFVGCADDFNSRDINPVNGETIHTMRSFVIEIDQNGQWKSGDFYGPTDQFSAAYAITKRGSGNSTQYVISGEERINEYICHLNDCSDPDSGMNWSAVKKSLHRGAFVFVINELSGRPSTTFPQLYTPLWTSLQDGFGRYGDTSGFTRVTDVAVASNGIGDIILPVAEKCEKCYRGASGVGEGKVYRINPLDGTVLGTIDLGTVKAYDLKLGVTATNDGGFAIVTTKQPIVPFSSADTNPLPFPTSGALSNMRNAANFWRTDAYVAKFDNVGTKEWERIFDSHSESPAGPSANWIYPIQSTTAYTKNDLKRQECVYSIVQAEDGGYAIAGNSSSNLDDSYVVKLNFCEKEIIRPITGIVIRNQNENPLVIKNASSRVYSNASTIEAETVRVIENSNLTTIAGEAILFLPTTFIQYSSTLTAKIDLKMDCDPSTN